MRVRECHDTDDRCERECGENCPESESAARRISWTRRRCCGRSAARRLWRKRDRSRSCGARRRGGRGLNRRSSVGEWNERTSPLRDRVERV